MLALAIPTLAEEKAKEITITGNASLWRVGGSTTTLTGPLHFTLLIPLRAAKNVFAAPAGPLQGVLNDRSAQMIGSVMRPTLYGLIGRW